MKLFDSAKILLLIFSLATALRIYAGEGEDQYFFSGPDTEKYALILVGASMSEQYERQFFSWATQLHDELVTTYRYQPKKVRMLLGDKPKGFEGLATLGVCNSKNIEQSIKKLAREMSPRDQLSVFIFGHGSGYGEQAKFNIVGPDLTGAQFASLLSTLKAKSMVIINTTGSSYDFNSALVRPGRVVLSATRSSAEKYDTQFPQYLLTGIQNHHADRDKNQRLSVLEIFLFVTQRVQGFFRESGRLATEHSVLDDNGDGVFSLEPGSGGSADGNLAEIAYLDAGFAGEGTLSDAAARLKTEMDKLERSVFLLRGQKSFMNETEYWKRMEPLLIELAQVSQAFEQQTEKGGGDNSDRSEL